MKWLFIRTVLSFFYFFAKRLWAGNYRCKRNELRRGVFWPLISLTQLHESLWCWFSWAEAGQEHSWFVSNCLFIIQLLTSCLLTLKIVLPKARYPYWSIESSHRLVTRRNKCSINQYHWATNRGSLKGWRSHWEVSSGLFFALIIGWIEFWFLRNHLPTW
jgi:hypothetical protein